MEEEREVLEDVSKTLKAKVIEDLIHYDLVEPCSNCYFLVGLNMKKRKRTELVEFLMTNIEIFAWTLSRPNPFIHVSPLLLEVSS